MKSQSIISCTTTYGRLNFLYHTLISIEGQSLKPDKVFINTSTDPYLMDEGISRVPEKILNLDLPIEINWVENTGPYRKLLPVLEVVGQKDIIVTIDDDVIYHEDWYKNIIGLAEQYPDKIIAGRVRIIRKNRWGRYMNYKNWPSIKSKKEGLTLLPIGVDGVAYRKHLLDLNFITDKAYLKIAPKTDDLWFKIAHWNKKTTVLCHPSISKNNAYLKHIFGLQETNRINKKPKKYFKRKAVKIRNKVYNYMGIGLVGNDFNWKNIRAYNKKSTNN